MRSGDEGSPWREGPQLVPQSPMVPTADLDDHLDFGKYLHALRRRWQILFVCLAISIGYSMVQYSLTPKEYKAVTTVQIERKRLSTLALGQAGWMEDWWNMEYYPTQYRLLRSRGMAERVIVHLGLHRDPSFNPVSAQQAEEEEAQDEAADTRLANLAMRIQGRLDVNPIKETQLVELTYRSTSPQDAALIANAYADVFIDWGNQDRNETVTKASDYLSAQIKTLQEEIGQGQQQLNAFVGDSDFSLDPAGEALVERQQLLRKQRDEALTNRLNREASYRELTGLPREVAVASSNKASRINELKGQLFNLESQYETRLETYRPEWPDMVQLRMDIETKKDELERLVDDAYKEVIEQSSAELQKIRREEASLNEELRKLANDARLQNSDAFTYNNITTYIETRKELLEELVKRQSEVASVQTTSESNVRVVDRAITPLSPFRPSLRRSLLLAILFGAGVGVGIIFLLEFLDRTIKSAEELEGILGLPTLTVIPDLAERSRKGRYGKGYGYGYNYGYGYGYGYGGRSKRGGKKGKNEEGSGDSPQIELLPHHSPRLAVSEAYRSLRTALLLSSADELRVVGMTSAEPSEGKTTTTTNLGVVMAQLGRRVLIIDADLRRPRMHKVFQVSNRLGLVNYLTAQVEMEKLFSQTEVPNLWVCPSGPIPPNPSELLASERMREFLSQIRSRFDFVLIDTPPALPVADAVILGPLVDGLVVCARAGVLTRDDAKLCRERLSYADLRIFGTVLNRYRRRQQRYGKNYHHYYGVYEETESSKATTAA